MYKRVKKLINILIHILIVLNNNIMLCHNTYRSNVTHSSNKYINVKKLKNIVNKNRIMFDFIDTKINVYITHTHNNKPRWKTLLISFNYSTNKWKENKCSIIYKYKNISNEIKNTLDTELPYIKQKKLLDRLQHEWLKNFRTDDINNIINCHDIIKKISKKDRYDINIIVDNLCHQNEFYLSEELLSYGFDDPDEHRIALYRMITKLKH